MATLPKRPPPPPPPKKRMEHYEVEVAPIKPIKVKPKSGPGSYDPNSANAKRRAKRTKKNLSPSSKRRRDRFLQRYIIHWNGRRAALEIGIPKTSAAKAASEFLDEPYCMERLDELIKAADERDLCDRNEVIAGLKREANFFGSGNQPSVRVAAWGKLGKYLGMEKDKGDTHGAVHLHFDAQDDDA